MPFASTLRRASWESVSIGSGGSLRSGWSAGRPLVSAIQAAVRLAARPATGVRDLRLALCSISNSPSRAFSSDSRIVSSPRRNSTRSKRAQRVR